MSGTGRKLRRRYTTSQKEAALDMCAAVGQSEASRLLAIPYHTLTDWRYQDNSNVLMRDTPRSQTQDARLLKLERDAARATNEIYHRALMVTLRKAI